MNLRDAYHSFMEKTTFAKKCPNVIYKVVSNAIDTKAFSLAYHMLLAVIPSYKAEKEKSKSYFLSKKGIIEENLALLADECSKKVYSSMIEYRCRLKYGIVNSVSQKAKHQYLDEVIVPCKNETFVDVGAFFGESTAAFEKYIKSANADAELKSLIIEPDKNNYEVCTKNLAKTDVIVFAENCAAGADEGEASFISGQYGSSRVDSEGKNETKICTADSLVEKHGLAPTYIKYDTEGYENQALTGTHETILKFRPRLAISIYHSDEDMVEIIQRISKNYPFYDLYVRHYTGFFADTVLYCIEKK